MYLVSISLSLHDAATNCARDGAICTLTLKSGVKISGQLQQTPDGVTFSKAETAHMKTDGQGWTTVLIGEIAAVGVRRPDRW